MAIEPAVNNVATTFIFVDRENRSRTKSTTIAQIHQLSNRDTLILSFCCLFACPNARPSTLFFILASVQELISFTSQEPLG